MDDTFDQIQREITELTSEISRMDHAANDIRSAFEKKAVRSMSNDELLEVVVRLGQARLKRDGLTMPAAEFYQRAAKVVLNVSKEARAG